MNTTTLFGQISLDDFFEEVRNERHKRFIADGIADFPPEERELLQRWEHEKETDAEWFRSWKEEDIWTLCAVYARQLELEMAWLDELGKDDEDSHEKRTVAKYWILRLRKVISDKGRSNE